MLPEKRAETPPAFSLRTERYRNAVKPVATWLLDNQVNPERVEFATRQLADLWIHKLQRWTQPVEIGIAGSNSKVANSLPHVWLYILWPEAFPPPYRLGQEKYRKLEESISDITIPVRSDIAIQHYLISAFDVDSDGFEATIRRVCAKTKKLSLAFLKKDPAQT